MGKTLVTGATGFTGTALCKRLVEDGGNVVAFIRSRERAAALERIGVDCRVVDIKSAREIDEHFDGVERVFHLAAAWRTEYADRDEFRDVNVEATRHLLAAASRANVRHFLHCSTVGVQGRIDAPPADETYRFNPGDHYQRSKLAGELLAREYFAKGLPGTVVRPSGIYGPGDTRFLKLFRAISKGIFVMIGSGRVLYHLTYIDDLIDGILLASRTKAALGEVFTLAGPSCPTNGEFVALIAEVLGKRQPRARVPLFPIYCLAVVCDRVCRPLGLTPPLYPRRLDFFSKDRAFDIGKARRLLGYTPRIDLEKGLRLTAEWYRSQSLIN